MERSPLGAGAGTTDPTSPAWLSEGIRQVVAGAGVDGFADVVGVAVVAGGLLDQVELHDPAT